MNTEVKPVGVLMRSAADMAAVVAGNPFPGPAPSRAVAIFFDEPPPRDAAEQATRRVDEQIRLGRREIHVHYGNGMGQSRLNLSTARAGTARDTNTTTELAEMAAELG